MRRAGPPVARKRLFGLTAVVVSVSCQMPAGPDPERSSPSARSRTPIHERASDDAGPSRAPVAPATEPRPVIRRPFSAKDLGTGSLVQLTLDLPQNVSEPGGVLVLRREDGLPRGPDDKQASEVYRGSLRTTLFDSGVVLRHTYYYAAYACDRASNCSEGFPARVHVGVQPVTALRVTDPGLGNRLDLSWRDSETAPADFVRVLRFVGACDPEPEPPRFDRRVDLAVDASGRIRNWTDDEVLDGVDYCYAAFVRSGVHYSPGTFASGRSTDATPPSAVSGLSAAPSVTPGDVAIDLSWTNPADPDFQRVRILRREGTYPQGPEDQEARVVCDGPAEACRDRRVDEGVEYLYRAWVIDEVSLFSSPADAATMRPYVDDDGDGYREDQGDCDDSDGRIHPRAASLDCSGTDWDCDGAGWDDSFGVAGACRSPGTCGDASCNSPGPRGRLPPATGHAAFTRTGSREPVATDHVTGLTWQGCPAGLRGGDCAVGSLRSETFSDALTYCDGLTWAGYDDWRLPDHYDLLSIVDYGRVAPAIDPAAFPATSDFFWSSSCYAAGSTIAWVVHFAAGHQSYSGRDQRYHVRCVRSEPPPAAPGEPGWKRLRLRERASEQPVIIDAVTALMWQGCAAGLDGRDCSTGGAAVDTWDRAVSYCDALGWGGFDDWRLPDVKELASIVDTRVRSPAIDPVAFPATPVGWYWSSLSWVFDPLSAWQVNFSSGHVSTSDKTFVCNFRCVRRAQ